MSGRLKLEFAPLAAPAKGVLVLFCEDGVKFGSAARRALGPSGDLVRRAAAADRFKGKSGSALDLVAPSGLDLSRLVIVGVGKARDFKAQDFVKLGGIAMGKIPAAASEATLIADLPGGATKPERAADMALGLQLRAYAFEHYKTKRKDDETKPAKVKVTIAVAGGAAVEKAFAPRAAVADGVAIARDLVNEPANVLYPEEFARRAGSLKKLGAVVDVLGVKEMKKLGMNALQRRQTRRRAARLHRQGRLFRYWRNFDQARWQHGGYERRYGGSGVRGRPHACARGAQSESQRCRRHRHRGEHARRQSAAPGRYRHHDVGADHRDHQHRRRGPARALRLAPLREQAFQAEVHDRSRHFDRRDHRRAGAGICRIVRQ